jgi:mediator of RNA polymerase II transcription subunit 17
MSSGISSVEVTVETPGENQVVEVSYDGQEILQPPLTLTENFTKQATKIDFETVMDEASSQTYVYLPTIGLYSPIFQR